MFLNLKTASGILRVVVYLGLIVALWFGVQLLRSRSLKVSVQQSWEETVLWTEGNKGDVLEVAKRGTLEKFEKRTTYDWWIVYFGTTTVRIRVPVVYRYHVLLSDPWELEVSGDVCVVRCPKIRPSLPPAILTGGYERYSDNAWARWDASDQLAELEMDLTGELSKRAGRQESIDSCRDKARESVAGFVRKWMLTTEFVGSSKVRKIKVLFPGEDDDDSLILFDVTEVGGPRS